jgi:hypothetical protein
MFTPESPSSQSESSKVEQNQSIDSLSGVRKSDEIRSLIDENANVDYREEGNQKMTEDLNCICAVLSGEKKLNEPFEYEKHGTREGEKTQAESAIKYLQKQESLQALKVAAERASFVSDKLKHKINSL